MQAQVARDTEVSAASVAANLLGYKDRICNHDFDKLVLWPFIIMAEQSDTERGHDAENAYEIGTTADAEFLKPTISNGKVSVSNLRMNYMFRPDGLDKLSLYDFCEYYEVVSNSVARRLACPRFQFAAGHSDRDTLCLVRRRSPVVPLVHGPSVPNSIKDPALFAKYMLLLHKPFRSAVDLRSDSDTWVQAFNTFQHNCGPRTRRLLQNVTGISEANRAHKTDLQKKNENPDAGIDVDSEIWKTSVGSGQQSCCSGSHFIVILARIGRGDRPRRIGTRNGCTS